MRALVTFISAINLNLPSLLKLSTCDKHHRINTHTQGKQHSRTLERCVKYCSVMDILSAPHIDQSCPRVLCIGCFDR